MKLSLGPVLFYWTREKLLNFYAEMLEQPLDVIYLGETVCSKRRAFGLDEWLGLARDLRGSTTAGANQKPSADAGSAMLWPRNAISAPSRCAATASRCRAETIGPIWASSADGSLTRNASTAGCSNSRNRGNSNGTRD